MPLAGSIALSPWSYRLVRCALAVLFIWAGVVKLADPESLAVVLDALGLVPGPLVGLLALGLPAMEVLAGLALLADVRGALGVITGLILAFIAVLAYAIHLGLDIDCGCYGPGDPEAEAFSGLWTSLYRDLAMLAGAVYLYWWRLARGRAPRRVSRLVPWGGVPVEALGAERETPRGPAPR